ncbi:UNVERIFIED_CONTAM: hypothetical protein Sangu_1857000 [Sesamum angustifolium]|uniref:Secreted protein n=1 Tax=Sesamum angustifolium TaxID=2727405 RepID=A0AAW2MB89_9LAMI
MLEGIATWGGANMASCLRITVLIICWIVPKRAGDSSPKRCLKRYYNAGNNQQIQGTEASGRATLEAEANRAPSKTCTALGITSNLPSLQLILHVARCLNYYSCL